MKRSRTILVSLLILLVFIMVPYTSFAADPETVYGTSQLLSVFSRSAEEWYRNDGNRTEFAAWALLDLCYVDDADDFRDSFQKELDAGTIPTVYLAKNTVGEENIVCAYFFFSESEKTFLCLYAVDYDFFILSMHDFYFAPSFVMAQMESSGTISDYKEVSRSSLMRKLGEIAESMSD